MQFIAAVLAVATIPGMIELMITTFGAMLPISRRSPRGWQSPDRRLHRFRKLAVLIPAHNECASIERCIRSIQTCDALNDGRTVSIVVIADNCADATADLARKADAAVMVRSDRAHQGKGF